MTEKPAAEEYVYHIGKIRFIVTPVYKETGELIYQDSIAVNIF